MHSLKIALVAEPASPLSAPQHGDGQDVHVCELARELGRRGHDVTIYTRRYDPGLRDEVQLAPGVTVRHLVAGPAQLVPRGELLPYVPDLGAGLARLWTANPPDVVHAHFWTSGLAAHAAAHGLGLPTVQTFHSLAAVERHHWAGKDAAPLANLGLERALARAADCVIATSSEQMTALLRMGVHRRQISVVPDGVDAEHFSQDGARSPRGTAARLLAPCRMVERGGVDVAIDALARVPDAELVVAGGPREEELETDPGIHRLRLRAKEAGVADRVLFLGRVPRTKIPELLRSADLTVRLPRYEPSGRVALESMACGVPVVVSRVGGHVDTVVDGVTGVHVPPGQPVEVAKRIRALLADPMHRSALGIAGADRAQSRFSWSRIADETLQVYERARSSNLF